MQIEAFRKFCDDNQIAPEQLLTIAAERYRTQGGRAKLLLDTAVTYDNVKLADFKKAFNVPATVVPEKP